MCSAKKEVWELRSHATTPLIQVNPLRTNFFSLPKKISECLLCYKLYQYCTGAIFLEKKCFTPHFLKRYQFVTMVHKGANFRTSLCFQSSLESKFEVWGDSKYIFKAKEFVLLNF